MKNLETQEEILEYYNSLVKDVEFAEKELDKVRLSHLKEKVKHLEEHLHKFKLEGLKEKLKHIKIKIGAM